MFAADVQDRAARILGLCLDDDSEAVYEKITDAVEVLSTSNGGIWDALTGYMDLAVPPSLVLVLPPDVLQPIKLNINKNPSFSRNQLYEFVLGGPGDDMGDTVDWSWLDKGTTPVLVQPKTPGILHTVGSDVIGLPAVVTILSQPISTYEYLGNTATFTVTVTGSPPITYQWKKNGLDIKGANAASYITPPVVQGDDGAIFTCLISNPGGSILSDNATLHVLATQGPDSGSPPAIILQPQDYTATVGGPAEFSVTASGSPLTYQWRKNDVDIPGATARGYVTPPTTLLDDGSTFSVVVTNDNGSVTSREAILHVIPTRPPPPPPGPPTITVQPQNVLVDVNQDATFSVSAIGRVPITYQWKRNGVAIVGATSSSYTLLKAQIGDDGAIFTVVVHNDFGDTVSDPAILTVKPGLPPPPPPPKPPPPPPPPGPPPVVQGTGFLSIVGRDAANNPISEVVAIGQATIQEFAKIEKVHKDLTPYRVQIYDSQFNLLVNYFPWEVNPSYRQIRVSKGTSIRMFYRRATFDIRSPYDYIPLDSRQAVLYMIKALDEYSKATTEAMAMAEKHEALAIKFLTQDHQARHNFDLVQQTESQNLIGWNFNNADSIVVADCYDDFAKIFPNIDRESVFDKMTEAIGILNGKAQWDASIGYVDLVTSANHRYITLPRYVDVPLAVNINGRPRAFRNKWFEFHLNGLGSDFRTCRFYTDMPETVIINPIQWPVTLAALCDNPDDADTVRIIVQGWDDQGKWMRSLVDGQWIDGIIVSAPHFSTNNPTPVTEGPSLGFGPHTDLKIKAASSSQFPGPLPEPPPEPAPPPPVAPFVPTKVLRIERIIKSPTIGFVHLNGFDHLHQQIVPLGYYYPDETEPHYRQIRIAEESAWVRMLYRKRQIKVTGFGDPVHLRSKTALVMAGRALALQTATQPDVKTAQDLMVQAVGLLTEQQLITNPQETFSMQFEGMRRPRTII